MRCLNCIQFTFPQRKKFFNCLNTNQHQLYCLCSTLGPFSTSLIQLHNKQSIKYGYSVYDVYSRFFLLFKAFLTQTYSHESVSVYDAISLFFLLMMFRRVFKSPLIPNAMHQGSLTQHLANSHFVFHKELPHLMMPVSRTELSRASVAYFGNLSVRAPLMHL